MTAAALALALVAAALIAGRGCAGRAGGGTRRPASCAASSCSARSPPGTRGAQLSWPPQEAVVRIYRHGPAKAVRTVRTGDGRALLGAPHGRDLPLHARSCPARAPCRSRTTSSRGSGAGNTRSIRLWLDTGLQFPDARDAGQSVETTADASRRRTSTARASSGPRAAGPIVPTVRPGEPSDEPCDATLVFYRQDGKVAARVASTQAGRLPLLPAGRDLRREGVERRVHLRPRRTVHAEGPARAVAVADRAVRHRDPVRGPGAAAR